MAPKSGVSKETNGPKETNISDSLVVREKKTVKRRQDVFLVDLTGDDDDIEPSQVVKRAKADETPPYLQCDICFTKLHQLIVTLQDDCQMVSTECGHVFCRTCILDQIKRSPCSKCPSCAKKVEEQELRTIHLNFKYK
ncbi:hypothetical protein HDE_11465 [Halotydeus destructor]|nr:hypothetical protein HDE_11465 [Halotydeus destructor]